MKVVFQKILGSWWFRLVLVPILIFVLLRTITNYYYSTFSTYGTSYNHFRLLHGIPVLERYLTVGNSKGLRWESSREPSNEQPVVHKWKNVIATDSDGWIEERDAFIRSVNDTTTTQLNIFTKKSMDKMEVIGLLGEFPWKALRSDQVDSVRRKWGI